MRSPFLLLLGVWRSARVPEAETRFLVVPIRRVVAAAAGAAAAAGVAAAVAAVGAAVEAGAATGQTFGNGPGHPSDLRKHLLDCLGFGFPALSLAVEAVTAASPGVLAHIASVARAPAFALQLRKRITSFVIQNQQSLVRDNRLLRHGKVTLGTH